MAIDGGFVAVALALASPTALSLLCSISSSPLVAERTAAVVAGVTPDVRKASTAEASVEAIRLFFGVLRRRRKKKWKSEKITHSRCHNRTETFLLFLSLF